MYRCVKSLWRYLLLLLVVGCALGGEVRGQLAPQQQLTLLSNWDNNNLAINYNLVYNEVFGWHDGNGHEYAILGSHGFTYFIEVTNPAAPVVRDSVPGTYNIGIHRDFKTYGQYCYGVCDEGPSTLQVMDLSYLPDSVHVVYNSSQFFERAHNLFIDTTSGRAYIAGSNTQSNGIIILDIGTNPTQPSLLASLNLGSYTHDLSVRGDTAYLNNGGDGLKIYDMRNATTPVLLAAMPNYPQQGYNHSSWLTPDGNYLAMCDETRNKSCKLVDVSDLNNVYVASMYRSATLFPPDSGSIPHNPLVAGQYVCVSYYHDGVQLFDISNPLQPSHVAGYDTYPTNVNYNDWYGAWGCYPFLPSGTVLGSDIHNGLFVFRVPFPFPYPLANAALVVNPSCAGGNNGSISLQPSGGTAPYTYQWATGQTTQVRTGLAAGTYVVTISDRYGYPFVDTLVLAPATSLQGNAQVAAESCPGTGDGAINLHTSGGTAPYQWVWSTGDLVEDLVGLTAGSYSVTITDSLGCSLVETIQVSALQAGPQAQAGQDTVLCGSSFVTQAFTPPSGTGHWQWVSGSGNIQNPALTQTPVTGLQAGSNALVWIVTDGVCTNADTVDIWVSSTAYLDAGSDTIACTSSLPLSGSSAGIGVGQWSSNPGLAFSNASDPNATAMGLQPGSYTLYWTVTEGNCQATDSLVVQVGRQPFAAFSFSVNFNTATFNNVSQFGTSWHWDFGDGGTSGLLNPTHVYAQPGLYTVCLVAIDTCGRDTSCQGVSVVMVGSDVAMGGLRVFPNPFEDRLVIKGMDMGLAGELELRLWDAQGRLVRELRQAWDGREAVLELPGIARGVYGLELWTGGARVWEGKVVR